MSQQHTGLVIVNLFAFRDTDPHNVRTARDAVGPANDEVLRVITAAGAQTIVAWGGAGRLNGRSAQVGALLDSPMCLGTTKGGEPRHPLYVAADAQLVPWMPPRPVPGADDGYLQTGPSVPLRRPSREVLGTIGALFDREPVQFNLRGDAYLWRHLRAQFATTPLPSDWYELRQLLEGGVATVVGDLLECQETLSWHDEAATVYVPAFDPGHGLSGASVHLPWWSHTGIPILLDLFQAQRSAEDVGAE